MSVKKRIKPGKIEPSADGNSIVVNFTNETTHLDEDGQPLRTDKSPDKREINVSKQLRGLREEDIPGFAQEIVEKCRYIPETKIRQVEHVIAKLLNGAAANRENANGNNGHGRSARQCLQVPDDVHGELRATSQSPAAEDLNLQLVDLLPKAHFAQLEDYAEELYEEQMEAKALGARRLLHLCTNPQLLDRISEHRTLLGVLSRELRENAKRSHELAVAITGIFLCFAHFSKFHGVLVKHQCNDVTMRVVEYETKRRAALTKELELTRGRVVAVGSHTSRDDQIALEREERRHQSVLERQDKLMQICLLMLRHFCDDMAIEKMLVGRRLCLYICRLLDRNDEDLLLVILGFLHKLVAFEENKDHLVEHPETLARIAELASHPHSQIASSALRVCYNVSFDTRAHKIFTSQTSLLATVLAGTKRSSLRKMSLKLLYQMTGDNAARSAIAEKGSDCIMFALQLLVDSSQPRVEKDAAALCVNLSVNHKCAAVILEAELFPKVVARAVQFADPLLLKIVRHLCSHAVIRPRLLEILRNDKRGGATWLHELVVLASGTSATPELLVEAIGILSNLECQTPEVQWPDLCEAGLIDVLQRLLVAGFSDDDLLLECIMLTSVLANDADTVPLLAASKVPAALPNLLSEKQEDCEMLVQLLFTLRCLLLQEDTCTVLLLDTDVPDRILDLIRGMADSGQDSPPWRIVRASAEETLDLIVSCDRQDSLWGDRIKKFRFELKKFRFELHNDNWCQRLQASERPPDIKSAASGQADTKRSFMKWTDTDGLADRCWDDMPELKHANSLY